MLYLQAMNISITIYDISLIGKINILICRYIYSLNNKINILKLFNILDGKFT